MTATASKAPGFLALALMLTRPGLALFFPRVEARTHTAKPVAPSDASARDVSFDYVRAFIVLLVLVHHSVLAYAVMWPAQPATFKILPAPIIDPQRWAGFDLLVIFNDTFCMALMFLLSGLFVWPSLERKGGARFLRDRILRLGVPFTVAAGILMPLAYYPSYAVTGADPGFLAYTRAWLSLGFWPSGPAWFIWLLLVFDIFAAGLHALQGRWTANTKIPRHHGAYGRPAQSAGSRSVPFHFRRAVRCSMQPTLWPVSRWAPLAPSLGFLRAVPRWHGDGRFGFQPGLPPMRYGSPSS